MQELNHPAVVKSIAESEKKVRDALNQAILDSTPLPKLHVRPALLAAVRERNDGSSTLGGYELVEQEEVQTG